ncbi:2Fe-2S iron-sulfur cluster-binding protein [Microvirga sp. Mcv34]|uniref:2Fe-2S iron-sulfur cluster-binding protein n=1 Tax=Microvirga sp. Mcv34 TaxID=2926016 RepID=UPI0021C94802|nr:2Fe-2S iron-sulfur cluster-binding protein [Microvirga sp. Mcv34]
MGGMMGGGMGEMGEMMGGRPQKEFYPSLMNLPTLSPEQRQAIEAQARARISAGTDAIASAESALRHANAAGDATSAEQAARRLRDGLNQVSSGTAALRALAEGKAPAQIAQDWFKGQLNLTTAAPVHAPDGLLGLSWFHLVTMALVSAFAIAMTAIYFARMRRANALVDRLSSATPAPAIPAAPPVAARQQPSSSGAPAPPAAPLSAAPSSGSIAPASLAVPVSPPARPGLWKGQLRVAAIFDETPNVKTFRLRNPQGGPIPFTFVPGHFLTYSAEIDDQLVRRSYTIASSAAQTAYVETTIKREEQGILSRYMHDTIKVGDLVDVMGPSGVFTFSGTEAESVVLIGGGVGITPLMAAIRYLNDIAWPGEIFLVYGARSTVDFIFRDELEHLQRRHPNLHVIATMARATGTSWMGPEGPITKELLAQAVPEITKRRVHLCGPPGMMEAMKRLLAELGVPSEQIKTEAFGPAKGAVPPPGVTVTTPLQAPADGAAAGTTVLTTPTQAPAIGPATASIRFAKSNKVVPLPPDQSVLEVAEAADVPIDYSCRVGICGICKTKLLEGQVTMEVDEALTPEDKAQNIILACQAKSIGNLVVDA